MGAKLGPSARADDDYLTANWSAKTCVAPSPRGGHSLRHRDSPPSGATKKIA